MKVLQYLSGRSRAGYDQSYVQTRSDRLPAPAWRSTNRASDTPGGRPTVEMMCTEHGQPAVIFSHTVNLGRPFTFGEFIFPDAASCSEQEWQRYMENPGLLMYETPVSGEEWLSFFDIGASRLLDPKDVSLDKLASAVGTTPRPSDAFLASLLVDLWFCCSERLLHPNANQKWPVLHLELTDYAHAADTLDTGRAFVCQHILPHLPPAVRHTVSVSIGGQLSKLSNTGYLTALQISLPGQQPLMQRPGVYRFVDGQESFTPLYASLCASSQYKASSMSMMNASGWTAMGMALAKSTDDAPSPLMQDYNAVSHALGGQMDVCRFSTALYLFGVRLALTQTAPGTMTVQQAEYASRLYTHLCELFRQSRPADWRRLLLKTEEDLAAVVNRLPAQQISWERYCEFFQQAMTLQDTFIPSTNAEQAAMARLLNAYTELLSSPTSLRDCANIPFLVLLTPNLEEYRKNLTQTETSAALFDAILRRTLSLHCVTQLPDANLLNCLCRYGMQSEMAEETISFYTSDLLRHGHPVTKIGALRRFQTGSAMDAIVSETFMMELQNILAGKQNGVPWLEGYLVGVPAQEVITICTNLAQALADHTIVDADKFRSGAYIPRQVFLTLRQLALQIRQVGGAPALIAEPLAKIFHTMPSAFDRCLPDLFRLADEFAFAGRGEVSESVLDVLGSRLSGHTSVLREEDIEYVCRPLNAQNNGSYTEKLRRIAGCYPNSDDRTDAGQALRREHDRLLNHHLAQKLLATPLRREEKLPALHECMMSIICSSLKTTLDSVKDYQSLRALHSRFNKRCPLPWLQLKETENPDVFDQDLEQADIDMLARCCAQHVTDAVARLSPNDLLSTSPERSTRWFSTLLNHALNTAVAKNAPGMLKQVSRMAQAKALHGLLTRYPGAGADCAAAKDALAFIIDHKPGSSAKTELTTFRNLSTPQTAAKLIRLALEKPADWGSAFTGVMWNDMLIGAACCTLLADRPDYTGFLTMLLPYLLSGSGKDAFSSGQSALQKTLFLLRWLEASGLNMHIESVLRALLEDSSFDALRNAVSADLKHNRAAIRPIENSMHHDAMRRLIHALSPAR